MAEERSVEMGVILKDGSGGTGVGEGLTAVASATAVGVIVGRTTDSTAGAELAPREYQT